MTKPPIVTVRNAKTCRAEDVPDEGIVFISDQMTDEQIRMVEQELDRGIAEAIKGPTFSISEVIADIDVVLAEMAKEDSIDVPQQKPRKSQT